MTPRRRALLASLALATCGLGAGGVVACSSDTVNPGELVVGVDTNIALPGRADGFVLTITRAGVVVFGQTLSVGQPLPKVLLPATVGVINGTDSPDPVTVRMMATENGQVIGLREAVLTVPTDRVALLQLTVDGLCLGDASVTSTVSAESASSGTLPASACGDGLTCILGGCQSNEVDAAGLPTFVATGAFGTSDGGTCFDSELCFHDPATAKYRGYEVVSSTAAGCTIPLPPGASAAQINVGIPADPSACEYDASPCVIPLVSQIVDQAPQVGFHVAGDQIVLPPGLCTETPAVTEVLVATAYLSAVPETPLCGSWSRVTAVAPDPDPTGVAVADAGVDATSPPPDLDGGVDGGDGGDAADAPYVWQAPADAGSPVAFTLPSAQPNLVAGPADDVIAWDPATVQVNHATADGGAVVSLVAGGTVGGVTADLGSVYIAGSLLGDAGPNVITMCSFTGCSVTPPAPTFTLPAGAGAATALTLGHGQLYGAFGGPPYACTLGMTSSCAPMAVASSKDVATFLAPAPEGVFYSGNVASGATGASFVPDTASGNAERRFLLDSVAGGHVGELAAAGATDQTLFFTLVSDSGGASQLERLDYLTGTANLTPSLLSITSPAHVAASSAGVVYSDATGIHACTLGATCSDATSHPLVVASGVTRLALGDSYLFWAVGPSVYSLPLPPPLRSSP